ncbi:MAG: RagB/SusD family nutrient uptake outer membrane protein [Chitinophagaceae bacterium]
MDNNIKKLLFAFSGIIMLLTSCKKDLEEYNPSGLTGATVYNKAAGFDALVNAAYSFSRFWYGKEEGYSLSEMGTDIWTNGTGDVFPQLSTYNNLQGSNTAALTLEWNNFYAAINLCNTGIKAVNAVEDYTPAQKALREAELRFLRAFYYWHIVETWGGVHFTLEPTEGAITTANKTPVDTFYNHIFLDLQFAVANLPTSAPSDYGRVWQPVAKAFLARMYLTRGKNTEAIAMANDVIANYGYSLQPKYADLWNMGNLKNKEIVWAIDYSTILTNNDLATSTFPGHSRGSNNGHLMFLMVYDQVQTAILLRDINNGRPFNRYMPTKALLDMYDASIDSRYDGSFQTVWYANKAGTVGGNPFVIGDTAAWTPKTTLDPAFITSRKYTIYDIPKVFNTTTNVPIQRKFYVSLKKFKDSTRTSAAEAQSARDAFVIRLSEMHLIAAEAEFKNGKSDSAAYYINIVRSRAALPGHVADMQITPAQVTLDFILDERAREFAGEQLRWFDLKRTGKLIDRINTYNPDAAGFIKPFHLVRPIPQGQLDAVSNKDEFKQNDGYL